MGRHLRHACRVLVPGAGFPGAARGSEYSPAGIAGEAHASGFAGLRPAVTPPDQAASPCRNARATRHSRLTVRVERFSCCAT